MCSSPVCLVAPLQTSRRSLQCGCPCVAPLLDANPCPPLAVRLLPYNEWKHYVDQVAAALASCPATVVWRGTMPIAEHAYRRRDGSAYFSAGHFQVSCARSGAGRVGAWRGCLGHVRRGFDTTTGEPTA